MDITNPDEWKRQWDVFMSAPLVFLLMLLLAVGVAWWFRGHTKQGQIDGLTAQIDALKAIGNLHKDARELDASRNSSPPAPDPIKNRLREFYVELSLILDRPLTKASFDAFENDAVATTAQMLHWINENLGAEFVLRITNQSGRFSSAYAGFSPGQSNLIGKIHAYRDNLQKMIDRGIWK